MSLFLRALAHHAEAVEAGASYRRRGVGAFVETALVVDVAPDKMGIPHVRYQLQVGRGANKTTPECRTLSLEAFAARYRERVG